MFVVLPQDKYASSAPCNPSCLLLFTFVTGGGGGGNERLKMVDKKETRNRGYNFILMGYLFGSFIIFILFFLLCLRVVGVLWLFWYG